MTECFVDTSAVFAVLDRNDRFHAIAAKVWHDILDGDRPTVMSNYVVLETASLLQSRMGKIAARGFLENILPLMRLEWIDPYTHVEATTAYLLSTDRDISLVDCTSFVVMRKMGIRKAFAFDKRFKEQGFEVT